MQKSSKKNFLLSITDEKIRGIFNLLPVEMALTDVYGNVLDCNDATVKMRGLSSKEEVIGKNCFDFIEPSQRLLAKSKWMEAFKSGKIKDLELTLVDINQNKIQALVSGTLLYNFYGKPFSVLLMMQDITKALHNEKKIVEQSLMLENANDAIVGYDLDFKINFWNKSAQNVYGYKNSEAIGKPGFSLLKPIYLNSQRDNLIKKLSEFGAAKSETVRHTKNGKAIYIESNIILIKDGQGKPVSYVSVDRDVTDRKKNEKKLKNFSNNLAREKAKDEALLEGLGQGIVATDKKGKILFANEIMKTFLRGSFADIKGKYLNDVIILHDAKGKVSSQNRPVRVSLSKKSHFSKDYYCLAKNNKRVFVNVTMSPIFLKNRLLGAIGIYRDITKEREIENAKTEFVSLASHELRTPITEISLSAEMLLSGMAGKLKKEQKKYLQAIQSGVKEITSLVETLLNVSRIQMGTFSINPKPSNLLVLTNAFLEKFSLQIKAKKLQLKKTFPVTIPEINLDPNIYQLIFDNLFSNAIKYTEKGHVGVEISKNKNNAVIKIFDSGCGIPESQQHLVFAKLFRADNSLKSRTKGYGLGLFIIKSVIEKVGGKIWFESREGKGTSFYVSLPLKGMKKGVQSSLM